MKNDIDFTIKERCIFCCWIVTLIMQSLQNILLLIQFL